MLQQLIIDGDIPVLQVQLTERHTTASNVSTYHSTSVSGATRYCLCNQCHSCLNYLLSSSISLPSINLRIESCSSRVWMIILLIQWENKCKQFRCLVVCLDKLTTPHILRRRSRVYWLPGLFCERNHLLPTSTFIV